MNQTMQISLRLFSILALLVCSSILQTQEIDNDSASQDTELNKRPLFVPGESYVEESGILERMEAELGQKLTPEANRSTRSTQKKKAEQSDSRQLRIALQLKLKDGTLLQGHINTRMQTLDAIQTNGALEHRVQIKVKQIASIEILGWKARRITRSTKPGQLKVFYLPHEILITQTNGEKIQARLPSHSLLQIHLKESNRHGNYQAYFTKEIKQQQSKHPVSSLISKSRTISSDGVPDHIIVKLSFNEVKNDTAQNGSSK